MPSCVIPLARDEGLEPLNNQIGVEVRIRFSRETLLARYARQGCSNRVLGKEVRLRATELARSYRTQTGQSTQTMNAQCRLPPFRCRLCMPLFRMEELWDLSSTDPDDFSVKLLLRQRASTGHLDGR